MYLADGTPPTVSSVAFFPASSIELFSTFRTMDSIRESVFPRSSERFIRESRVPTIREGTSSLNISP